MYLIKKCDQWLRSTLCHNDDIIIIIITGSYITLFYSMYSMRYTTQSSLPCIITPGHWIQNQSCTHSVPSQLTGEHILARRHFSV